MSDSEGLELERAGREKPPSPRGEGSKILPLASRRLTVACLKALAEGLGLPTTASAEDIRLMVGGKVEEMGKDQLNVEVVLDDPLPEANSYAKVSLRDDSGVFVEVQCGQRDGGDVDSQRSRSGSRSRTGSETEGEHNQMMSMGGETLEMHGSEGEQSPGAGDMTTKEQLRGCQELLKCTVEALREEQLKTTTLEEELHRRTATLEAELGASQKRATTLESELTAAQPEVSRLSDGLEEEKGKRRSAWRLHCQQLAQWDAELTSGDAEIARLKARLGELERAVPDPRGPPRIATTSTVGAPETAALGARASAHEREPVHTTEHFAPPISVVTRVPVTTTSVLPSQLVPSVVPPVFVTAATPPRVSTVTPVLSGNGSVHGLATTVSPSVHPAGGLPAVYPYGSLSSTAMSLPSTLTTSLIPPHPMANLAVTLPNSSVTLPNPTVTPLNPTVTPPNPMANLAVTLPNSSVTLPNPTVTPLNPTVTPPNPMANLAVTPPNPTVTPPISRTTPMLAPPATGGGTPRRGKAPPVDPYTGEDPEANRFEDWLPTLERASTWNGWSDEECLMQLAGHLHSRALAEWNLLTKEEKHTYSIAVQALRARLDPGSKVLAAQDLRHAIQKDDELVADYILRVERCFQRAYGQDNMSVETREAILYGQLQDGLKLNLMKSPSVSGSRSYTELKMSAKNEEKRLIELKRHQQYQKGLNQDHFTPRKQPGNQQTNPPQTDNSRRSAPGTQTRKCYKCGCTEHLQKDCRAGRSESSVKPKTDEKRAGAKMIQSTPDCDKAAVETSTDPLQYLESDDETNDGVRTVRVDDRGSKPQLAVVDVQGVPAEGIIDTGSDITIMGAELFKRVASVAHLKKSQLKRPDKVPYMYEDVQAGWKAGARHHIPRPNHAHTYLPEDGCP